MSSTNKLIVYKYFKLYNFPETIVLIYVKYKQYCAAQLLKLNLLKM